MNVKKVNKSRLPVNGISMILIFKIRVAFLIIIDVVLLNIFEGNIYIYLKKSGFFLMNS